MITLTVRVKNKKDSTRNEQISHQNQLQIVYTNDCPNVYPGCQSKEWKEILQGMDRYFPKPGFQCEKFYGSHLTANHQQVLLHQVQAPKNLKLKLLANRIEPRFVTCECQIVSHKLSHCCKSHGTLQVAFLFQLAVGEQTLKKKCKVLLVIDYDIVQEFYQCGRI